MGCFTGADYRLERIFLLLIAKRYIQANPRLFTGLNCAARSVGLALRSPRFGRSENPVSIVLGQRVPEVRSPCGDFFTCIELNDVGIVLNHLRCYRQYLCWNAFIGVDEIARNQIAMLLET